MMQMISMMRCNVTFKPQKAQQKQSSIDLQVEFRFAMWANGIARKRPHKEGSNMRSVCYIGDEMAERSDQIHMSL